MSRCDAQLLQEAIAALPVRYRETILLCEVEEMSYQEIAESLSVPIGTVMSRLSRARRALRDDLQLKLQRNVAPVGVERGMDHGL
jgi:RNA polymerase sigma-70 factor (ECF subfamily)